MLKENGRTCKSQALESKMMNNINQRPTNSVKYWEQEEREKKCDQYVYVCVCVRARVSIYGMYI